MNPAPNIRETCKIPMAVLPIIIAPDPRLKACCEPVEQVNGEIVKLMDDLLASMYAARGIGLSAPQVGVLKRVIVVDTARREEEPKPLAMANPEVAWVSEEMVGLEEGCLSFPEHYAQVTRPARVGMRYLDRGNTIREIEADGLLARCLFHEMDHLDGVLFVDHLSLLKRSMILRKLVKMKKLEEAGAV